MSQIIAVSLPESTLYVSGTVNGVDKVWTNTEGNTWETIADAAPDGKYIVELTIISSGGSASSESLTLYYGVTSLITDRTEADAQRAIYLAGLDYSAMTEAEKAEWDSDLKGAYNASDLNRVESAVEYLAGLLRELPPELQAYAAGKNVAWDAAFTPPYDPADMNPGTKTDWVKSDIPTPADMSRYLGNVKSLKNALSYATDPLPDNMDNLTWQGANAIERALKALDGAIILFRGDIKILIDNTAAAWFYSGEVYTGEV